MEGILVDFNPLTALGGGALIGLAATLLLAFDGRIAGVSGILGGLIGPLAGRGDKREIGWRTSFLVGLMAGVGIVILAGVDMSQVRLEAAWPALVIGGLLTGFGTGMGGGCTSGHGVCGLARFSKRSLSAVVVFMATAAAVVFLTRHVIGG